MTTAIIGATVTCTPAGGWDDTVLGSGSAFNQTSQFYRVRTACAQHLMETLCT